MDVGRDARPFRLGGRNDEVALEGGAGREPRQWPDGEPAGQQDEGEPELERDEVGRHVRGERHGGVAPTTANSVDSRTRPLDAAAPRQPAGLDGSGGGEARDERDRPDQRPAGDPSPVHASVVATAMAMTAAPAVQIGDDEGDEPAAPPADRCAR